MAGPCEETALSHLIFPIVVCAIIIIIVIALTLAALLVIFVYMKMKQRGMSELILVCLMLMKDAYFICMHAASGSHDDNVTLTNGPVGTNSSDLSSVRESEVRVRTRQDHSQHVQNPAYDKAGSDAALQHTYATLEPPPSETCSKQGNLHLQCIN